MRIVIQIGTLSMEAELNDTSTAQQIAAALPLRSSFNTWGDEIYFAIPIHATLDDSAQEVVELGALGYWPPGKAFCIFFGQTCCQCHWESPGRCHAVQDGDAGARGGVGSPLGWSPSGALWRYADPIASHTLGGV